MKNENSVTIDTTTQNAFDSWFQSHPQPPEGKRPLYKQYEDGLLMCIFAVLAFLGFLAAMLMMVLGATTPPVNDELILFGFFGMFGFPLCAAVMYVLLTLSLHTLHDTRYERQLRELGWERYDEELEYWKLIGDEDFHELATTDSIYRQKMSLPVYGGHPPGPRGSLSYDDLRSWWRRPYKSYQSEVRYPSSEPELDQLEARLETATPGMRGKIELPSKGALRRRARQLALEKRDRELRCKRFIAQTEFSVRRPLSANSVGWISSVPITEAECVEVKARLEPHFAASGLCVLRCDIAWQGMRDGDGGSYEMLVVTVRVA